jgi:hypothetical protein
MTIDDSSELRIEGAVAITVDDRREIRAPALVEEAHHGRGDTPHRSEPPAIAVASGNIIVLSLAQLESTFTVWMLESSRCRTDGDRSVLWSHSDFVIVFDPTTRPSTTSTYV